MKLTITSPVNRPSFRVYEGMVNGRLFRVAARIPNLHKRWLVQDDVYGEATGHGNFRTWHPSDFTVEETRAIRRAANQIDAAS